MKRETFVVGDVHGCFNTLLDLVNKLPKEANLIFVGDLCDKGLYTKEVIEFIIKNGYRSVLGNHDMHMILNLEDALNGKDSLWNTSSRYYGSATVNSYKGASKSLVKEHISFLKSLPAFIEIDRFLITHGFGLPFYKGRDEKFKSFLMRVNRINKMSYKEFYEDGYESYDIINIFGHISFDEVQVGKNYYAIDTNVKRGNKLSAISLDTLEIVNTKANNKDLAIYKEDLCVSTM